GSRSGLRPRREGSGERRADGRRPAQGRTARSAERKGSPESGFRSSPPCLGFGATGGDGEGRADRFVPRQQRARPGRRPELGRSGRAQVAGVGVISGISGVENSRIGGPQKPVPRCAYPQTPSSLRSPRTTGCWSRTKKWKGKICPPWVW